MKDFFRDFFKVLAKDTWESKFHDGFNTAATISLDGIDKEINLIKQKYDRNNPLSDVDQSILFNLEKLRDQIDKDFYEYYNEQNNTNLI